MDRHWLDKPRMRRDGELGGRGSFGTRVTCASAEGLPTRPGLGAASPRHRSSPLFAKRLSRAHCCVMDAERCLRTVI